MTKDQLFSRRDKADFFGKKEEANCQLCNNPSMMTKSHVPTDALIEEQYRKRTAWHYFDYKKQQQYRNLQAGIIFYTLCKKCNEVIGAHYEDNLIQFSKTVRERWRLFPRFEWSIECKPNRIARSIIAGMLTPKCSGIDSSWKSLQDYVKNTNNTLPEGLKIGFWLHNYHSVTVIPQQLIITPSKPAARIEFVMKCFPLAWIVYYQDDGAPNFSELHGFHDFTQYLTDDIDAVTEIVISPAKQKHESWPSQDDGFGIIIGQNALESAVFADANKTGEWCPGKDSNFHAPKSAST